MKQVLCHTRTLNESTTGVISTAVVVSSYDTVCDTHSGAAVEFGPPSDWQPSIAAGVLSGALTIQELEFQNPNEAPVFKSLLSPLHATPVSTRLGCQCITGFCPYCC